MKHPIFLAALLALPAIAETQNLDFYQVENIKLPEGVPPEVGGIDFAPDGTLFVVLRRGDIFRAKPVEDPEAFEWEHFATGFHNGCGIDAVSRDKVRVTQMAEMTEVEDTDGDGHGDRHAVFAAGWGLSGNYHETNTLTGDGDGGYYLAIGTASHNGPVFENTLGEYSATGQRGRNFASVKWKGWVLHCSPEGELTPFASGFRMHNGIYRDPDGNIWAGDNQGDWKAVTPLYHIEKGNFYGHPSSLVWDENWKKSNDPLAYYRENLEEYNKDRTYAAVEVPHDMNRSAGEPIEIPRDGEFGPFAGDLLLPDNNGRRISRIMLEQVKGRFQGAVTHFIDDHVLRSGNHRTRFSADKKQLYVGQTVRGWGTPAEGLQRITWKGGVPFDIEHVAVTPTGFRVAFTKDVPDGLADLSKWKVKSFTYQPKWTYGSAPEDVREHELSMAGRDGKELEIKVEGIEAGRIYDFRLPGAEDGDGSPLQNQWFVYTANELP